jgi:hypothetical protein
MACRLPRRFVLAALLAALVPPGLAGAQAPLPVERQITFLTSAKVVASRPIGKGITGARRVTLSDGTLTHDAAFQAVAESPRFDGKKRAGELRFVDHYRYNLAAWRLAVLLGLGAMMPATVERTIGGTTGALSWWVDDVMMDEEEREKKDAQPPSSRQFGQERQRMLVFAELVRDTDRNKGNVVYTKDWRLIMLDFTRAFRLATELRAPAALPTCDRRLFTAMKALTREQVETAVGGSLQEKEIAALLARRDKLVAHFEALIAQRGERAVLY